MYGTQTQEDYNKGDKMFENDVKMYGTQTVQQVSEQNISLRMM